MAAKSQLNELRGKRDGPRAGRERVGQPLFQFRLDLNTGRFVRELKDSAGVENALKDPNFVNGQFKTHKYSWQESFL